MRPFAANATAQRAPIRAGRSHTRCRAELDRRATLLATPCAACLALLATPAGAREFVTMEAIKDKDYGKSPMKFPDYESTESGLQYKDLREGSGAQPRDGDTCVIDWDGYTVGYYGRVFEARNKPKGSSFEGNDKDYVRLKLGSANIIPGVEEALRGMRVGGVRRVIVPEQLGYPNADFKKWAPSPTTFSGQRTLDFVLKSKGFIDKTLLIDIELLRIA